LKLLEILSFLLMKLTTGHLMMTSPIMVLSSTNYPGERICKWII